MWYGLLNTVCFALNNYTRKPDKRYLDIRGFKEFKKIQ